MYFVCYTKSDGCNYYQVFKTEEERNLFVEQYHKDWNYYYLCVSEFCVGVILEKLQNKINTFINDIPYKAH